MAKKKYSPIKKEQVVILPKPEVKKSEPKTNPKTKPVEYTPIYIGTVVKEIVNSGIMTIFSKPIYAGKGAILIPYIELTEEIKKRLG